jgi:hypothetical protein
VQRALFRIDQVVHPCGHDEVVAVQAANGVGPPLDGDLAPFQEDAGSQPSVLTTRLSRWTPLTSTMSQPGMLSRRAGCSSVGTWGAPG